MDEERSEGRIGRRRAFVNRLRNYLLTGIIVAAPLTITAYLVASIVNFVDGKVKPWIPARWNPESYVDFPVPGIGVLVAGVGLILLGFLAANIFGRTVLKIGESILARMPLIRTLYAALKQIFETMLSERSRTFRTAGLIEYPRKGLWALVFIATDAKGEISHRLNDEDDAISVFLPTTPNPTSGFLLFVPRREVLVLDMSVEDAAKLVISAGLITPHWRPGRARPPSWPTPGPTARLSGDEVRVPVRGRLIDEPASEQPADEGSLEDHRRRPEPAGSK
ncbi:DUF502 domain-containing protein [Acuticoccus sp.]|uniref:DUF502 domain-containing protein n=1 Tax=Acuticoccus sp. TaxID=1904378 RepID=UPI003B517461